ncbi:GNAT family N-acetyltransferase [Flavobacterium maritimum]|uniref:GNAT family N-acetyltransferase n=1 Tax=Flavobacterium maritimum TaxID=3149042 RepID=UPI0032B3624B
MKEIEFNYKKASQADINYLLWLRKQTMTEHFLNSGIEVNDEYHLERIKYHFEDAKVILLNENPIGLLKVNENEIGFEIIQIQIDPEHQGKGFGKKIIQSVIDKAASQNLPVQLSVLKNNKAKKLYKSLGFQIINENADSLIMKKENES